MGSKFKYSFPGNLQVNEKTETTNKMLLKIIKKKLTNKKGTWAKEFPGVKTLTREIPFSLTYTSEVVVPVEVGMPTYRF